MPEIAEVEVARKTLDKFSRGKKITSIDLDAKDRFFFSSDLPPAVRKALLGARITGSGRKGKYFWLALDRKPWPLLHLGMTGKIVILTKKNLPDKLWDGVQILSRSEGGARDKLLFSRMHLTLNDGTEIALTDPRRFAKIWLIEDPAEEPRLKRLGPDPLHKFTSAADLRKILQRRKMAIKAVLLDQKVFAGVGNWVADEILFQAQIDPHRLASDLTPAQVGKLRQKMLAIIRRAIDSDGNYERFPKTWLFHHRWGKNKNAQTSNGKKIIHDDIGGRTTAWVPSVQK